METTKIELKIGDYVELDKKSEYYETQGSHSVGEIVKIDSKTVEVRFFDTYQNSYWVNDLKYIDKKTYKKPDFIAPTIGADPELELFDEFGIVNASNIVTSRTDCAVGTDGNSQIAELRPTCDRDAIKLTDNIGKLIKKLKFKCDEKFGKENYIVRSGNGKRQPIGGHIHFGIMTKSRASLVNACDLVSIALSTIYNEKFFKIRVGGSYGKLSDVRDQPWGVEYRTLPSFLINKSLTESIFCTYHCLATDFMKGELIKNKRFIRLNKWLNDHRSTICNVYNSGETRQSFKFKLKTIYKMVADTWTYNNLKGYKSRVDNLFKMIIEDRKIDENTDIISNWGIKDVFGKTKMSIFRYSTDVGIEKLKIKKNSFTIKTVDKDMYKKMPVMIYGLKKDRNLDIAVSNEDLFKSIKKFLKENKLKWSMSMGKYSQSWTGEQIGLSLNIREKELGTVMSMLNNIQKEVKR